MKKSKNGEKSNKDEKVAYVEKFKNIEKKNGKVLVKSRNVEDSEKF